MKMRPWIGALLLSGLCAAMPAQALPSAAEPAAKDEYPLTLPQMPLHDPWIVTDPDTRNYYLYTSNVTSVSDAPGVGIMVYASRDLKRWAKPHLVFELPPQSWGKAGAWAPEVHRWNGRWLLLTTVHDESAPLSPKPDDKSYRRGTIAAVADSPLGPFTVINQGKPVVPEALMTLDGTLYEERGQPWFVYSHEWLQVGDGRIEAVPVNHELQATALPRTLFRASEASWVRAQAQPDGRKAYVTDGPELYRSRTGQLLMLWSSWGRDGYVQAQARSRTGKLAGPWEQLPPLLGQDSGHGMLFKTLNDELMMVVHRPFKKARGKLYEMRDGGDRLELGRQRTDLDGDPTPALTPVAASAAP